MKNKSKSTEPFFLRCLMKEEKLNKSSNQRRFLGGYTSASRASNSVHDLYSTLHAVPRQISKKRR